jgi:methyltransferase (TIGR00027 family)
MALTSLLGVLGLSGGAMPAPPEHGPALSRFSNLASTGYKRHLQSLHESGDRRNPDHLAGALLSPEERHRCLHMDAAALDALRAEPYYHYLTARTKAYDLLLLDAVVAGLRRVVIVGSGLDTRFHRYGGLLAAHGVDVAECDQPDAIAAKRAGAAGLPYAGRVGYFGIDLNSRPTWASLAAWVAADPRPVLMLAEGVSPYVETAAFVDFLQALAGLLPRGSRLGYDFKLGGVADGFGRTASVTTPFRLEFDPGKIVARHRRYGFEAAAVTASDALMHEHVPSWSEQVSPLFREDALIVAQR